MYSPMCGRRKSEEARWTADLILLTMPLTPAVANRTLLHTRIVEAKGYVRDDNLYDLEAHLFDVKTQDKVGPSGTTRAGEPIHDMWLRFSITENLTLESVEASFNAAPYAGHCDRIAPDYRVLVGLTIGPGFVTRARELLKATHGCTHMTDLISVLATLAFQTFANRRAREAHATVRPFQLNRCHTLAETSDVVKKYYPRWFRSSEE
ncbi:DUF2889 domain-containing protein [Caballeronia sp. GaOx3]|uniref:DUF2889 domain-containing protein n=1 Tax=Caballeronia sp. GaOx3 TaxID=2921740 RepID=UPI0020286FCC|nr:DUF2889 domain-containing protein [Caballeronia sp. GaOx3]